MNKVEAMKAVKDGLEVLDDIPAYAAAGWQSIPEGERDRLKWAGIFFRRQTPGRFMMRVRITNGISNSAQFRALAGISDDYGKGFGDLTTRQQIQLREFAIDDVPDIWERLNAVGLVSLQTGMDNIRTVVGCPAAGLTPHELLDASPVARQFTDLFVGNREYTNLPRKFNVAITGCLENCIHASTQDVALTPAVKELDGREVAGFNVAVGGKMGSGGYTPNTSLDLFVRPEEAAEICSHVTLAFRDHGPREARNKIRLAFLIADWGAERFRAELERRAGRPLLRAGRDASGNGRTDHVGVFPQQQPGLNYVGLCVPVGRITAAQLRRVADLADDYGDGETRITLGQNLIIPNVPDGRLAELLEQPLLRELSPHPSEITRGTVSCTGIDYCHYSLIETKERAVATARALEKLAPHAEPALPVLVRLRQRVRQSRAGRHRVRRQARANGRRDSGSGGHLPTFRQPSLNGKPPAPVLTNVPCADLPAVLERMLTENDAPAC